MAPRQLPERLGQACSILFGSEVRATPDFLRYLQPEGVKAAFRSAALATHPDRAVHIQEDPSRLNQRFIEVVGAYEAIMNALEQVRRPEPAVRPSRTRPAPRREPAQPREAPHFFGGALPGRRLRLGEFLYYSGIISWQTFIDSLLWQRKSRPSFGEIAVEWRLLDREDIGRVISGRRMGERFGESAVRQGLLKPFWVKTVLLRQGKLQPLLGRYYLERSILGAEGLSEELERLERHNRKAGAPFPWR